jgi:hypothetical protein
MEALTDVLLEAVFTVVGILVAAAVSYFTPRLKRYLDKLSEKDDLGIVENIVDMGVELAEKELAGEEGEDKFNHAATYVAMMAHRYGIDISSDFIRGAVQKGWRRMNDKQKND